MMTTTFTKKIMELVEEEAKDLNFHMQYAVKMVFICAIHYLRHAKDKPEEVDHESSIDYTASSGV